MYVTSHMMMISPNNPILYKQNMVKKVEYNITRMI